MLTPLGTGYIQLVDKEKNAEKEKLLGGCDDHARNVHPHNPREQYPGTKHARGTGDTSNNRTNGDKNESTCKEELKGKTQVATSLLTELASNGVVDHSSGVVPPEKMSRALSPRHPFIGCFWFTHNHTKRNLCRGRGTIKRND